MLRDVGERLRGGERERERGGGVGERLRAGDVGDTGDSFSSGGSPSSSCSASFALASCCSCSSWPCVAARAASLALRMSAWTFLPALKLHTTQL